MVRCLIYGRINLAGERKVVAKASTDEREPQVWVSE